jgi:hypothetical protein
MQIHQNAALIPKDFSGWNFIFASLLLPGPIIYHIENKRRCCGLGSGVGVMGIQS